MNIDPNALGLTWKDGLLMGIIVGQWLNARGRIDQGRRLGKVEKIGTRILAHLGLKDDEDKK